jgi:pyridoxal phosphate enzyme (YggS family)
MGIRENLKEVLKELPENVLLVGATKTRTPEEVLEAVEAGLRVIGENYAQELESKHEAIGNRVKYHFIGHLQRNKVKRIIDFVDMIETVDSVRLAREINKRSRSAEKVLDVLVEINSGEEEQKAGVFPEKAEELVRNICEFSNIRIEGFMTMGPMFGNPENARPFFVKTREIFERVKSLSLPNVEMKYLSMGMSNSYRIAIEEGANMVRIGTRIFGERKK